MLSLLEKLESEPESHFERTLVCEPDDAFILSQSNIDAAEEYLHRLEKDLPVSVVSLLSQVKC